MAATTKRIGVIGFDGVNAVDLVGPLEVFASAGRADFTRKDSKGHYELHVLGLTRAAFVTESGVRFVPDRPLSEAPPLDTIIVPGGWGLREPATTAAVSAWLDVHGPKARRIAAVCTGVYGLAPTGLLDGRRVTTHWRFAQDVAKRFPRLIIDGNAIFLRDGRYYTSGGVTAGIDLALALVEEDLGPRAEYVESLRLNFARERLASVACSIEQIAASVGFGSADVFRRRFKRRFGISPQSYRERFQVPRKRHPQRFNRQETTP
jgi:transcriptional regulator GlxA family with amidase domain